MQLKYFKDLKDKVVTINLETSGFTKEELDMLDDFGEPIIVFDKVYGLTVNHHIKFERKIKSGFKLSLKFDGIIDLEDAINSSKEFMEDIQVALSDAMRELKEKAERIYSISFDEGRGFVDINY